MEDEIKINKTSIILFIVFTLLLIVLFFVITGTSDEKLSSYMGRYISSVAIDSKSMDKLKEFGITTKDIKYELLIKNNQEFVLYIDAINDTMYTGEYTKSLNKFNLKIQRIYNISNACYNKSSTEYVFKGNSKTLITSDINGNNLAFTKLDNDITKYDDQITKIIHECGSIINY